MDADVPCDVLADWGPDGCQAPFYLGVKNVLSSHEPDEWQAFGRRCIRYIMP